MAVRQHSMGQVFDLDDEGDGPFDEGVFFLPIYIWSLNKCTDQIFADF